MSNNGCLSPGSKASSGELGLASSALSELGCGVQDDGSQGCDDGRDDSEIGVALPGELWEYTGGRINA